MPKQAAVPLAEDVYLDALDGLDPAIKARSRLLREHMSKFEKSVWKLMGGEDNPWGLLRQVPMCGYYLDFYSPAEMACVEADGPDHVRAPERDAERDLALRKEGIRILRITPGDFRRKRNLDLLQMISDFLTPEED